MEETAVRVKAHHVNVGANGAVLEPISRQTASLPERLIMGWPLPLPLGKAAASPARGEINRTPGAMAAHHRGALPTRLTPTTFHTLFSNGVGMD